ncbi:vesicle-associated membrane protein 7-like [Littorina saxatilis]|uniref:Vesicle-associated membrane protein 7 n=1 Tax=Littorina saxatilis TaxID=31220 RepID=A0AAN9GJL9_9CAEN
MTIIYSCVARGTTVLCSNQTGNGTFSDTIKSMLNNIPSSGDGKRTYTAHNNDYHCLIENGILYVCVTESGVNKQQPYSYLAEIKRRFQSGPLAGRAVTAGFGELDRDFNFVLAQQMKNFSKAGGGGDTVSKLQSQVDEVKGVMTQNIEKVMERGDRLEDLMDKTEELENSAQNFQRTSRKISRRYWWKNKKMTLIICGVSLLVVIVIVIIILFSTGVLPPKSSDDSGSTTTKAP